METIRVGRTDMRVSRIGMGAWQFSGDAWGAISYEQVKAVVARAVEAGINFFDTAAVYGRGRSEEYLGRAIKELGLRDWVYIATKIHGEWLRRIDILTSVENAGAVGWMLSDDDWRKLDRLGWEISQRITYVTW